MLLSLLLPSSEFIPNQPVYLPDEGKSFTSPVDRCSYSKSRAEPLMLRIESSPKSQTPIMLCTPPDLANFPRRQTTPVGGNSVGGGNSSPPSFAATEGFTAPFPPGWDLLALAVTVTRPTSPGNIRPSNSPSSVDFASAFIALSTSSFDADDESPSGVSAYCCIPMPKATASGRGVPSTSFPSPPKGISTAGSASAGIARLSLSFDAANGESFPILGSIISSSSFASCWVSLLTCPRATASGLGVPSPSLSSPEENMSTDDSASAGVASPSSSFDSAAGEFFPTVGSAITSSAVSSCWVSFLNSPQATAFVSGLGVPSTSLSFSGKGTSNNGLTLLSLSFDAAAGEFCPILGSVVPSSAASICSLSLLTSPQATAFASGWSPLLSSPGKGISTKGSASSGLASPSSSLD
mmetsp:Transcript_15056/g.24497  ORF Transcript_15056/g.24497 Transcript_15056/m.24497 type:complete len:409 (-) Transcript_15056:74-1300(-)